jgi:hypothetical protein
MQLALYGFNPVGLQNAGKIDARLLSGGYSSLYTYGWSEFDIDPRTRVLHVSTYGIEWYKVGEVDESILARESELLSRFVVRPR